MDEHDIVIGIALEEACLTLEQLAAACAVEPEWVRRHIEEGLFPAVGAQQTEWRFTSASITRARRIREIERGFEAPPELAALFADLLEEMDALKARLRRGGAA
jgi:chaperone modulatory protein CbpM